MLFLACIIRTTPYLLLTNYCPASDLSHSTGISLECRKNVFTDGMYKVRFCDVRNREQEGVHSGFVIFVDPLNALVRGADDQTRVWNPREFCSDTGFLFGGLGRREQCHQRQSQCRGVTTD